ncbi:Cytochrome P450 [Pyrenophora seminiperda CCB06]|uniref:Cytochrome P450 n=1 Tax=Pyrenophora seminiperda CCB06 TaxID=1302712 RepID=A0A3M7LY07_9PLEO|nr:Cytochrome P450 [Pyrenophora seminiperda CCB06]
MTDPLSITASVVGITVPALHGVRLLMEDLQQLKETPKTVKRLLEDVQSVETSLNLLQGVEERDWDLFGANVLEKSKTTISSCTQACSLFRTDLQRWTRHSEGGKLAWQDRTSVGFFKQGQIKAMSEQLQNCKLSINSVVSIATFSVRHTHITENVRRTMSLVQAEVKGAATTTDKQLVVLESKVEELNLSSDDEQEARPKEGKAEVLQQLEEERKALEASRTLLAELLSKAQEEAVAKAAAKSPDGSTTVTNVTFGNENSGQQAGVINGGVHGAVFGGR